MHRYKLILEYDGTPFHGWQRQDGFPSVQQVVEEAISKFTQEDVTVFAAGRTDTGVHALGQVVHLDIARYWRPAKIQEAANGLLRLEGHPVSVLNVTEQDGEFDARFSARMRHYRYVIINRIAPLTVELNRAWWIRHQLDVKAMNDASVELIGHHDFTTFRSSDCQAKSPMRTLERLEVTRIDGERIEVVAESRSFLHNQVRSIVGSLKMIGDGKWNRQDLARARDAKDRKACGPVAPACGLYLVKVEY